MSKNIPGMRKGTVDVRMPDAFYVKLWSEVARVDAEERAAKGLKMRQVEIGEDGSFREVI